MKQGSTDDPFAEDPATDEADTESDAIPAQDDTASTRGTTDPDGDDSSSAGPGTPDPSGIPYIYRRDAVKANRKQRPVYLREYNERRIGDLVDDVEADLGEEVTKTDVLEAAMETAIDHPDLVAETLRSERYGYDWD